MPDPSLYRKAARWWALIAAVVVVNLVVLAPPTYGPINPFDEGFVVSGAMMIRRGAIPIRDFYVIYGPGQYYLTAGIFALFGENLLYSRAAHLVMLSLLGAALVGGTVLVSAPRWRWTAFTAVAFVLVTGLVRPLPGYAAIPATLLLVLASLAFARAVGSGSWGWLFAASVLTGAAGVMRWDFGLFGWLALLAALACVLRFTATWASRAAGATAVAALPALAIMLAAFTPLLLMGDAQRWFREVPTFLVLEFSTWRNLGFIGPSTDVLIQGLQSRDGLNLASGLTGLVFAVLPFVAAAAAITVAFRRLQRTDRNRGVAADAGALMLALLSAMLCNQMRIRAGWQQGYPSYAMALPLLAYLASAIPATTQLARASARMCFATAVLVSAVLPLVVLQGNVRKADPGRLSTPQVLERATGTLIPGQPAGQLRWANYVALVQYVRAVTEPGEAIFSGVAQTDRLFTNDAMLYFLTDRPAATRWIEMEPGLTNSKRGQLEVVRELKMQQVRTVITWARLSNERNATGQSNGVDILDRYVQANYRLRRVFGDYRVLERITAFTE